MEDAKLQDLEKQLGEAEIEFYQAAVGKINQISAKIAISEDTEEIKKYLDLAQGIFSGLTAGIKRLKTQKKPKKKGQDAAVAVVRKPNA